MMFVLNIPKILLRSFLIFNLLGTLSAWSDDLKEGLPYKLAIIHTKALNPEDSLVQDTIEPENSVVSEFHWILETLRNRCLNPDTAIADTLVETWQKAKILGFEGSLLDISRELSVTARNKILFGEQKVNFLMTSHYWLNQLQVHNKVKTK